MKALKLLIVALLAATLLTGCGIIRLRAPGPVPALRVTTEPTAPPPPGLTKPPTPAEEQSAITAESATQPAPAVLPTKTSIAATEPAQSAVLPSATQKAAAAKPSATKKAVKPSATKKAAIAQATKTPKPTRTATATQPTPTKKPTRTPAPPTPTRPTAAATSNRLQFYVTFVDSNRLGSGDVPFVDVLRTDSNPVILPAVVLNRLFDGPTEEEQASGLVLITNGFTGVRRLDIAGGVARIYLKGACTPGGSYVTIADLILRSMEQFRTQIPTVKIYDEYGRTRYAAGPLDSAPRCLYP